MDNVPSWNRIHWFDVTGLATKLRNDEVSKNDAFHHFLIYSAIMASGAFFPIRANGELDEPLGWLPTLGLYFAAALVSIHGLRRTYLLNEAGDDRDYFLRLAALTLPVSLRVFINSLAPFILLLFITSSLELSHSELELTTGMYFLCVSIYYYLVLAKAFRLAAFESA
jgi:hypothetical protein